MSDAWPDLELRLCPLCSGEPGRREACRHCLGAGLFDQTGEPFVAPPPFDGWEPARLVALSSMSHRRNAAGFLPATTDDDWRLLVARQRTLAPVPEPEPAPRMTLSRIVELLLSKSPADHSTVRLSRNAKGDTQIDVSVRTGEAELETVEAAEAKAREVYDRLSAAYPMKGGE